MEKKSLNQPELERAVNESDNDFSHSSDLLWDSEGKTGLEMQDIKDMTS
jgi:hypothetical protein